MTDFPKNAEGERSFYRGIENFTKVEADFHSYLAKPEFSLGHVLNDTAGFDFEPVYPADVYLRRQPGFGPPLPFDDKRIADYESRNFIWAKDCAKVLAILKSILCKDITDILKVLVPRQEYDIGSRANILNIINLVKLRWGGYSVAKGDLSDQNFRTMPKFTSCKSVTSVLEAMRLEVAQRESWSNLPMGIDYRFREDEKKSRLVSLMDSWDELTILHNRLRIQQCNMSFEAMVSELLDAILPLQQIELIDQQKAVGFDRNHGTTSTSMSVHAHSSNTRSSGDRSSSGILCHNCGRPGHKSYQCDAPICNRCHTSWPNVTVKDYHHNSVCPSRSTTVQENVKHCTNCQSKGHIRQTCLKPLCSSCGTTWHSNKHPGYHHCDQCPWPNAATPTAN